MKYPKFIAILLTAPMSVQAQYEPFKTLGQSMAYKTPTPQVLEMLCEDGSMAKELGVPTSRACEQKLLVIHSQIERYASEEADIFNQCDRTVDGLVHEVWDCMEDLINQKYGG